MKISFYGSFDNPPYEGIMQFSNSLKKGLEKEGFKIVYNTTEADVLHAISGGVFASSKMAKLKAKHKIPCVYSLMSTSESKFFEYWKVSMKEMIDFSGLSIEGIRETLFTSYSSMPIRMRARNLKKLDNVIVPLEYMKKKLFDNTSVIRQGIDLKKFRPKRRSDELKRISYIGYVGTVRGTDVFAKASRQMTDSHECAVYAATLDDKQKRYLMRQNPRIKIYGFKDDITEAYNGSDVIVLPFAMTLCAIATPLVLLEAMACGRAIVTTDIKNVKEIVADSALTVKPYSPRQISEAVEKLEDNKLRAKLGSMARKRAEEFDVKKMIKQYIKVYEELKA
jgi:glycosyltransferase involved in cell wall biosynthesis